MAAPRATVAPASSESIAAALSATEAAAAEYRRRWEEKLQEHARKPRGHFSHSNLVPEPQPEYWQHAPHVPFDELRSAEAQSHLSTCRLQGCMREATSVGGRASYACMLGDTEFRQRNPQHFAHTLAFMLGRDDCHFVTFGAISYGIC